MASWHLTPALTAWRNGVNARFPNRKTTSDGTIGDPAHQARASQHNPDSDGSVDAWDMDVNLLGSSDQNGTATERRLIEALKLDFEADGRAHLWIHDEEIASREIGPWSERDYNGANPHDQHVHWESRQAMEREARAWLFKHTDALLRELGLAGEEGDDMIVRKGDGPSEEVKFWQYVLVELGYGEELGEVDGRFGDKMQAALNADRKSRNAGSSDMVTGWHAMVMLKSLMQKFAGKDGAPGRPGKDATLSGTLEITGGTLTAVAKQQ